MDALSSLGMGLASAPARQSTLQLELVAVSSKNFAHVCIHRYQLWPGLSDGGVVRHPGECIPILCGMQQQHSKAHGPHQQRHEASTSKVL